MRNKLTDLNNLLFAQLERLSDESLSAEEFEKESRRTKDINNTAANVINNASLTFKIVQYQHVCEYNGEKTPNIFDFNKPFNAIDQ